MEMNSIEIFQKNSHLMRMSISDEQGVVNLTDMKIFFVAVRGGECIIEKSTSHGIEIVEPEQGLIEINLESEDTNLRTGTYHTEVLLVYKNTKRFTVFQGRIIIKKSHMGVCNIG